MLKFWRENRKFCWIMAILINLVLIYIAYKERGYFAIGGEGIFFICPALIDILAKINFDIEEAWEDEE